MPWQFSVYLVPPFLAGTLAVVLARHAWHRRDQRATRPFLLLMFGLAVWSFGYGIELGFTSLEPMLRWDQVAFVGSVIVPTAWFLLGVEYAGVEDRLTRPMLAALAVEPAVTLALVWTNDAHGLIWAATALDTSGPVLAPRLTFGPAYWANLGYSYLLSLAGFGLIGSVVSRGSRLYRRQSLVLLVGTATPFVANVVFHLVPSANPAGNLDLTTFAFALSGGFYALAVFRLRLLDLVPTARETLVEAMDDGTVIVDADGVIVDANPAARRALGGDRVGQPLDATPLRDAQSLIERTVDGEARIYEVSETALSDFRGEHVGRFLLLRDITRIRLLRDQEQRLAVLNRVLRHNLRNELTVVAGVGEELRQSLEGDRAELAGRITDAAARMRSIGEKARHVESTLDRAGAEREPVDVGAVATAVGAELDDRYPDAAVDVATPEAAWATAIGRRQLSVALENLVENAVVHNPADRPRVWIRVRSRPTAVRLSVIDDGPGIPEPEWAALTGDRESPLRHGSGLGLWLVRWIVEASDGELSRGQPSRPGEAVTITLDRAAAP